MGLFGGYGGGGFDWGGFANNAASIVGGIYSTKAQTKLLKQLNRLRMGGVAQFPTFGGGGLPMGAAMGFAPSAIPAVVGAASPGASSLAGILASLGLGGMASGLLESIPLPGGLEEIGSGTGLFGLDMFEPTKSGSRARKLLRATNPSTGNDTYWRHVGAPLLFRGDLSTCKLVSKVAARAARGRGRASAGRFRRRRAC